ncbi:DUF6435 family protein [Marinimicrobium agarilyticum]|uniref:DUF6435 family protein n=1 Tax=Marinimicrobium agarilyticum TaxID=306546 RepID=UPI00042141E0|nr:DUF6435 family protein [Marinimicrobium agarilyticum]
MFGWLKPDPQKRLQKAYEKKLEAAMVAQRSGDIKTYSLLSEEADGLYRELQALASSKR